MHARQVLSQLSPVLSHSYSGLLVNICVLSSCTWLVATILASTDSEHFCDSGSFVRALLEDDSLPLRPYLLLDGSLTPQTSEEHLLCARLAQ